MRARRLIAVATGCLAAVACNGGGTDESEAPATLPPGPIGVSVTDAWCEPLTGGGDKPQTEASSVACYMTVTAALEGDALLDVVVPAELAERAAIEVVSDASSVATAPDGEPIADDAPADPALTEAEREVVERLEIPPEQTVQLQPGGYQIVVSGVQVDVADGTEIEMTLVFERAGEFVVVTDVRET
jgi:copper(I)-binding protein